MVMLEDFFKLVDLTRNDLLQQANEGKLGEIHSVYTVKLILKRENSYFRTRTCKTAVLAATGNICFDLTTKCSKVENSTQQLRSYCCGEWHPTEQM